MKTKLEDLEIHRSLLGGGTWVEITQEEIDNQFKTIEEAVDKVGGWEKFLFKEEV